ncbi:MAG: TetR family transcriptional regulator [Gemmatimonadaceae bacterium]|nr:TetR family transcriptional regulator [Gemmatimonadaceae bacterium]
MPAKRRSTPPLAASTPSSAAESTADSLAEPAIEADLPEPEPTPAQPPLDDAFRRRPRQSRGQKRVELLLEAAATVIARDGIEAATAEAIAAEARTAKGSLYQFFPNRDAVLAALALRYADELRAIHERALPLDPLELPLDRLIDRVVRPLADFHDRTPAFRRVFSIHDAPTDDTGSAPARLRSQLFESFVDRLDVLFATRNPRLPARDRRRAALITATIGQAILAQRGRSTIAVDRKAMLDDLRRALLAYLQPLLEPEPPKPARRKK